jgi:hypothetical protein
MFLYILSQNLSYLFSGFSKLKKSQAILTVIFKALECKLLFYRIWRFSFNSPSNSKHFKEMVMQFFFLSLIPFVFEHQIKEKVSNFRIGVQKEIVCRIVKFVGLRLLSNSIFHHLRLCIMWE